MALDFNEKTRNRIESDLASFADPGGVKFEGSGRRFHAEWVMRGESCEATFTVSSETDIFVHIDGAPQPYGVFLAGTRMADLRYVAQMIEQTRRREIFVPTRARRKDEKTEQIHPAAKLLTQLLEQYETDVTQILMVTGEAGSGKTRVIQELVRQQAGRYLQGRTGKLLLYVNAQGRALARLNEALATELQDLKVSLTYHSIATLAREGLLVPVIDGFDELLGVSGYDDAFNSLATFMEQLDGQGKLIASARSVYYEEEFLSRAGHVSTTGGQAWSHIPIEILPWEKRDHSVFLKELAEHESLPSQERAELGRRVKGVFADNEELASKPLFFAKTVDLLRHESDFSAGDDLLSALTDRYLDREQREKLLDRQQQPLLSDVLLAKLMNELAEEMWNQETRELSYGSVREVADYILEAEKISESARQIIVERMPTLAFLTPSERHSSISFEHEVFFFHFLARVIVNQYLQGADMRLILSRSVLPEFVANRCAYELRRQGRLASLDALQDIFGRLAEAGQVEWRRRTQVRENIGRIVLALVREFVSGDPAGSEITNVTISGAFFPGGDLSGVTFRNCDFEDVSMSRTNLRSAEFFGCKVRNTLLLEPRIRVGSTRLEMNGLRIPGDVVGIHELSDEGSRTIYDPNAIARVLAGCGLSVEGYDEGSGVRQIPQDLSELLDKLMQAYRGANPICVADERRRNLFRDPRWPVLRRLLIDHGIVKPEPKPASGPPKEFLRRQIPLAQIMSGINSAVEVDPRVVRFWEALENVPP